eukprot:1142944-Pelagomonas_calceolata.AAC.4
MPCAWRPQGHNNGIVGYCVLAACQAKKVHCGAQVVIDALRMATPGAQQRHCGLLCACCQPGQEGALWCT